MNGIDFSHFDEIATRFEKENDLKISYEIDAVCEMMIRILIEDPHEEIPFLRYWSYLDGKNDEKNFIMALESAAKKFKNARCERGD